ncbi:MAG TPA: C45 family autoproteolytic acyltransferase/hydrolase [Blastocatellia bacterium]|nr:C45 family autoproteolytic acyltransferase/hydrolase [Blastocatellia bacterium]
MSQKRLLLSFSLILLAALYPARFGAVKEPGDSSQKAQQTPPDKPAEPNVGEAPPTLEQILDKYVRALGGKAALQAPTSRVMKGTLEAPDIGAKGAIEIYAKAPNKQLTEVALAMVGNPRAGFNGNTAWQEEYGEVKELTVYPRRDADFYLPLKLRELFPRIELKGKEKLGAREVYRLEAPRGGNPRRWYFDTESGLLLRVETRNPEGHLLSREDYEDYRAVDGIQFPFTTRQLDQDQIETVIKYSEIKHNVSVDDAKFDMPAAKSVSEALGTQTKQAPRIEHKAIQQDRVIAGGPKDFMEVRHLALKGSNEEIGQALAIIAKERYRLQPMPSADRFRTRVERQYIKERYPILFERMRGVATAFGRQLEDDACDFSFLEYTFNLRPGCSVVYYPPGMTADGNGVVSRNYEYSTGTMLGAWPARGELAATARPYLIELRPDRGYASLALYAYDLLNGVLDGINSEGLTVTMLADDELSDKFGMEPADNGVGLGVQQTLRLLLDTCATVEEAKEALLLTKQYYEFIPVHYLIADRHGKAFVWEYSQFHNREYIVENPKEPLITTNFSLHRYLDGKKPPQARQVKEVCSRYCSLAERIASKQGERLTLDFIKENQQAVSLTEASPQGAPQPPERTLWHALYVPERRAAQISFYLRDEADPTQPGKIRIVRSDYLEFSLK